MNVRRVTLAVDTAHRDQRALRDAARIAAQLKAEVTALFVTNASLQRFAALPTATEVSIRSARTRRVEPHELASDLDRLIGSITRELRSFAHELDVAWNVVSTPLEALPTIPSTDLLLVDRRAGHTPVSRAELGSVAAKLVTEGRESILLFERELALDKPVGVLIEPQRTGALEMALAFARASGQLLALIYAPDRESYERRREQLRAEVARHDIELQTEWISTPHGRLVASSLRSHDSGLFVIDAANPLLQHEKLTDLLDALRIPVLLTR
jgi:nucleotide-binding universal stress UspA family protein